MYDRAGQCASDSIDALNASDDKFPKIIDVSRLSGNDYVVGTRHIFGRGYALNLGNLFRYLRRLPHLGLDEDVRVDLVPASIGDFRFGWHSGRILHASAKGATPVFDRHLNAAIPTRKAPIGAGKQQ